MKMENQTMNPEELLDTILEKYIKYSPKTPALIPFNYCILPNMLPKFLQRAALYLATQFCS